MTEPQSTDELREQIADRIYQALPVPVTSGWEGTAADLTRHNHEAEVRAATDAAMEVVAPLLAVKQAEIDDLDTRRARWAEEHQKRWEERDAERSSRQDWAAEAMRLEARVAELTRERDHLQEQLRHLCDSQDRIRYAAKTGPDIEVDDLIEAIRDRVAERDLWKGNWERAQQANTALLTNLGRPPAQKAPPAPGLEVGEPLCVLDESNDIEAFAALPECPACEGTGKDVPADFWGSVPPGAAQEAGGPPAPRVWHEGDPEPDDRPTVRDCQGDTWRHVGARGDGAPLWMSAETALFTWEYITRKWSPLTEVLEDAEPGSGVPGV